MTKQEELEAWERFASSMPTESYSKGAIYSVLTELRHALASDYIPTLSLTEASRTALSIIDDARVQNKKMLADATAQAERIVGEAEKKALAFEDRLAKYKWELIAKINSL
jgi:cell division septum initiation protein DivIVA